MGSRQLVKGDCDLVHVRDVQLISPKERPEREVEAQELQPRLGQQIPFEGICRHIFTYREWDVGLAQCPHDLRIVLVFVGRLVAVPGLEIRRGHAEQLGVRVQRAGAGFCPTCFVAAHDARVDADFFGELILIEPAAHP
jgi:hypothetical protein